MGYEQVVKTWLTELAVAPRHHARRERTNGEALSAPRKEEASVDSRESGEPPRAA